MRFPATSRKRGSLADTKRPAPESQLAKSPCIGKTTTAPVLLVVTRIRRFSRSMLLPTKVCHASPRRSPDVAPKRIAPCQSSSPEASDVARSRAISSPVNGPRPAFPAPVAEIVYCSNWIHRDESPGLTALQPSKGTLQDLLDDHVACPSRTGPLAGSLFAGNL